MTSSTVLDAGWLDDVVLAGTPDHAIAMRFSGGELSYGDLRAASAVWRDRLAGVGPGDAVVLQVAPSVDYVTALLGALRTGAQVLLVDHRLTEAERAACLRGMSPRVLLTAPETGRLTRFQPVRDIAVESTVDSVGWAATEHRIVQFSSGATGNPKVIGRTQSSLTEELDLFAGFHGWVQRGDVLLALNSLTHSFGLIGALLHSFRSGATVVFADRALPKDLRSALETFRPTAVSGVPAHFDLLSTLPLGALDSVRVCVSGGELMSAATYERFAERHRRTIGQSYGLTETGMLAGDAFGVTGPAVGWVAGHHLLRVIDGLVEVAMPQTPYLTDELSERYAAGWLRTGDRGSLDERGVLTALGRGDSLTVIGGLKVDLTEIERTLTAMPEVDEAVVLVVDGEIAAYVGSSAPVAAERLHAWCAERLAPYKIPRRFRVDQELPRTTTGKLMRRADQFAATEESR